MRGIFVMDRSQDMKTWRDINRCIREHSLPYEITTTLGPDNKTEIRILFCCFTHHVVAYNLADGLAFVRQLSN